MKINNSWRGKRVSVLGMGKTGISCANLLSRLGANVFLSEVKRKSDIENEIKINKNVEVEFGGHSQKILSSDLVISSPGISPDTKILKEAIKKKVPVVSELEFSFGLIKPKSIIAVTGTNGKTTTTTLIGEIIKKAGYKTIVCGNIGTPLSDFVEKIDEKTIVIIEVSSFQLFFIKNFKPNISIILNITPDHLYWHKSFSSYLKAKTNIFLNQEKNDFTVLNYDDKNCRNISKKSNARIIFFSRQKELKKGVYYNNGKFIINLLPTSYFLLPTLKIPGQHNIENILASISACSVIGINKDIIEKTVQGFNGVEHRLETARTKNGIMFVNDSKSTNVSSTLVAIQSFVENPMILIMGGRDKGNPYTPLIPYIKGRVKKIIAIGEAKNKIFKELNNTCEVILKKNLKDSIKYAYSIGKKGDVILLSPGCSSFDQFKNFEHRGKIFKDIVNKL